MDDPIFQGIQKLLVIARKTAETGHWGSNRSRRGKMLANVPEGSSDNNGPLSDEEDDGEEDAEEEEEAEEEEKEDADKGYTNGSPVLSRESQLGFFSESESEPERSAHSLSPAKSESTEQLYGKARTPSAPPSFHSTATLNGQIDPPTPELEYGTTTITTNASTLESTLAALKKSHKKRKRKRNLTINTSNCKYEVVKSTARKFGMIEVGDEDQWNLCWTDFSVSIERVIDMKRFQKINHFPGMLEICRKDLLARNLNRLKKLFPRDYDIYPLSWCLPADLGDLIAYAKNKRNKTFICKPDMGCQGRGIFLMKNLKDVKPGEKLICQLYIAKPFLIDGFKFDLRVYILMTCCDPLRIYVYKEGLARFSTVPYQEPTMENLNNQYMHLTNYAVNKHNDGFLAGDDVGSKRRITSVNRWLRNRNYNVGELWGRIDDMVVKTVLSAHPAIKHNYRSCFPHQEGLSACFEVLGFDILLDQGLRPYLLEVNHSPSFHTEQMVDKHVKEALLSDTFAMLNLGRYDRRRVMEEDRRRAQERLLQKTKEQGKTTEDEHIKRTEQAQAKFEENNCGGFRLVYPCADESKYKRYFDQGFGSLYQETAASRAREECTRQQQEEFQSKVKEELLKRPRQLLGQMGQMYGGKKDQPPESPEHCSRAPSRGATCSSTSTSITSKPPRAPNRQKVRKHANKYNWSTPSRYLNQKRSSSKLVPPSLCSFEPIPIRDAEEEERIRSLSYRELLIRKNGVDVQLHQDLSKMKLAAEIKKHTRSQQIAFPGDNPSIPNKNHRKKPPRPHSATTSAKQNKNKTSNERTSLLMGACDPNYAYHSSQNQLRPISPTPHMPDQLRTIPADPALSVLYGQSLSITSTRQHHTSRKSIYNLGTTTTSKSIDGFYRET